LIFPFLIPLKALRRSYFSWPVVRFQFAKV